METDNDKSVLKNNRSSRLLVIHFFWLSEHTLCKESIVIMKKFGFEILTYLYVLRPSEFMYAIFTVMFVFMYVCVYVSEHDSI